MPRAWQGLGTPIPFAVSGLQDGEGRMVRTRTQLGTPYLYACTPGQPVPQATMLAPPPSHAVTGCYPSVSGGHAPRYKDLQYDGKTSWNSFMYKFVRMARSQQWSEIEQHDQFCFSLEGIASDYGHRPLSRSCGYFEAVS